MPEHSTLVFLVLECISMRLQYALPHQFRQAIEEKWPLLVPTGCVEYHGPHQALGLDTLLVEELLTQVAQRFN